MTLQLRRLLLALWLLSGSSYGQPQLTFSSVQGSLGGEVAFAVLQHAYAQLGIAIDYRALQGSEALMAANRGETDGELQRIDGASTRYPNLIQIPIPVNYLQLSVFSKRRDLEISDWYSLSPYRVGIVKGVLVAERGAQGLNTTLLDSYAALIDALQEGTIDVAVMPRINGLDAIRQRASTEVVDLGVVLENAFLYHYLNRRHAALVPQVEAILKTMLLDGTTQRLRRETLERLLPRDTERD